MDRSVGRGRLTRRALGLLGLTSAILGSAAPFARAESDDRLVTQTGLALDSAQFARLYGPGTFVISSLANTVIGVQDGHDRVVSNRFRSLLDGRLDRVRLYWAAGTGYSGGTGGQIRITVLPDDGSADHLPALGARPLAQTVHLPNLHPSEPKSGLDELRFTSSTTALIRGRLYHLLFENIDPQPADNKISTDNQSVPSQVGRPARWLNTTDWSVLLGSRRVGSGAARSWWNLTQTGSGEKYFSPIMQLTTTDGASQGVSDIESGSVAGRTDDEPDSRIHRATAQTPIRERFMPGTDKQVTGVSFAAACSRPGTLRWRIVRDGRELAAGRIEQPVANYATHLRGKSYLANFTWYDAALPAPVVLVAGLAHDLELHPEGSSQWVFSGHCNGSGNGFTWPAAFTESNAQHLARGRWVDMNYRDPERPRTDTNWPVVLHLAP